MTEADKDKTMEAAEKEIAAAEGEGEGVALDEAAADEGAITDALMAERDELRDKLLRALADGENNRKRAERERREASEYGGTRLARDLLSVYDNLNRALESVDEATREIGGALIEGIEITRRDLLSSFEKHAIRPIAPAVGEKFDPQIHQAMFEAPVPDVPAGGIIQVMQEGFCIGERLLRPAQVGVSSTPKS